MIKPDALERATLSIPNGDGVWRLSGAWTAFGIGAIEQELDAIKLLAEPKDSSTGSTQIDGTGIDALDTAGALQLHKFLQRARSKTRRDLSVHGLKPAFARLMDAVDQQNDAGTRQRSAAPASAGILHAVGQSSAGVLAQVAALLTFIGQIAMAVAGCIAHPKRIGWRPILFNIRTAGFDALPIVGLLALLLGIVVAYQGAEQLRRYGANIFVADLVGVSMLREFAPLITAIIIAGRSGSAYAAQIGTMAVTEEIDAMRTLGLRPLDVLVLPKLVALVIALPLLTVFADVLGVMGGMLMAKAQLGVGFEEFLDRFVKAVSPTTYWVGLAKAPVFAAVIAVVGCFQGFQTQATGGGGADSVGRQTTRSVVQAIFLVIVVDALFSVAFSALNL
jgi:phospholipid/cholesterol/gamma-HCH transport system permease protein